MYKDGLQKGEGVAHITLFGIKYAAELKPAKQAGCSIEKIIKKIIKFSKLKESHDLEEKTYISQIKDGMKLAQYVKPKKKYVKPNK